MAATATLLTRGIQGESLSGVTDRLVNTALIHEGVIMRNNPDSFEVLQNLGSDMNVKIGSTVAFDVAVIQGDSAGQGVFIAEHQNATQVLSIAASDPTNDRIDIVILRIYDDTFDSSGNDYSDLEVVTGTPDASPVAPAVPAGSFVLAEILVQDTVTQIVNGDITDKRVEAPIRGELVKTLYLTSNTTFDKADHPWLAKVRVRCQGGGGAGGGAPNTAAGESSAGAGGSGSVYAEKTLAVDALGASETVTVGAGGIGVIGAAGNNGAASSFGTLVSADPGTGGSILVASATLTASSGTTGPTVGIGDLIVGGDSGGGVLRVATTRCLSGSGGVPVLGGGGRAVSSGTTVAGEVGRNYGGGGSGAVNGASQGGATGGNGAPGVVIVELYA